ncbi:PepSY-associated TM helix domain-containing protein [Agarilytica rhodophyticola]|uniref:PepSY-associated TM helix domain-containing protein n=1 Tax=Agarilytica rhodophyticola TaxID=1737490 RepID=UPI000B34519A|nr:PepSY domain-containing protein [Agarilytica rhodophyticola]
MKRQSYSLLQQRIWRWHFFAGLMVLPFAMVLAITGGIYLFKPQFNAYFERYIDRQADTSSGEKLSEDALVASVLSTYTGAKFKRYTLPENGSAAVKIEIDYQNDRLVTWVNQFNGEVLHESPRGQRFMNLMSRIHGELLVGRRGSYLVEFMASWMIILIISGVFLWWPRAQEISHSPGAAIKRALGPPSAPIKKRNFWYHLHGVTGLWISGFVLLLLLSGLPWTKVWGGLFQQIQSYMSWGGPGQEWNITLTSQDPHEHHKQTSNKDDGIDLWQLSNDEDIKVTLKSNAENNTDTASVLLSDIVLKIRDFDLHPPIEIHPPRGENGVWTVRSMTPNRPLRQTHHFDRWSGEKIMSIVFTDYHPVKRLASYGIAFHEGVLFGWLNQLLGLIATLGVILLSITGFYMWWKRRPEGKLAAPGIPSGKHIPAWVVITILGFALFLPLFALSLAIILLFEFSLSLFNSRIMPQLKIDKGE